ncbi:PHP domain-containing protein [Acetonema longum]|uniref:PHP domain protein n=1 Tax=Acetonema longum DSM 6540 TaxID=1009370 RepID=F7NHM9_9FIRM|nr:PHP domain-containing protein [Acetonema longum]EGO64404.1 PHP domain protein [Acetonema longum DSM 6540]
MDEFVADLHVHSLLSPCAAVEMTPRNIILHAVRHGVNIIALADHNAGDNVIAAIEAAKGLDVTVLPAMEVETREEIHLVTLFDSMHRFKAWEEIVSRHRPKRLNDEKKFGAQFIVDAQDEFVAVKQELLLASLSLGIAEISRKVAELGGISIASHIDRPSYSIISQLGFIPADAFLAAVEVSRLTKPGDARRLFPGIGNLPVITASDAHTIHDFVTGPKMVFHIRQPNLAEIVQALQGQNARKVVV